MGKWGDGGMGEWGVGKDLSLAISQWSLVIG